MLPADSVFAIGGEDESEAEEDLLAEGTRRLGAIAANVSPTEGASSSREGTTGTDAPETLSCVTVPPVSPAHPFEFGSSPAAGVLHSQEGTRRFLESYHCGVGSSGRGTPSLCSTGGGHEQAGRVAERGSDSSNSSSRISAVHRTSAVDGNTSVYRPEVDGPPIVGIFVVVQSALRRPEVLFHHQRGNCECMPLQSLDLSRCSERSLWRGQSEAGRSGEVSCNGGSGETALLQWVEKFALPEVIPTRGHIPVTPAGPESRSWEGDGASDQRHSSHIFFTLPVAKNNSYAFGVSCYSVQNERLWDPSAHDDAVGMCAVCLVARVPFWGLLLFRLLPVTAAFFELMEGAASGSPGRFSPSALPTKVLVQLYDQLNTVNFHLMRYTEITFNLEAGLPPFIMAVTPGQLLVLVKALLLEKKILFYSSDASRASTAVLSFISLLPGGLACGFSSDGFGEHEYRWKRHGIPFRVFEARSAFFPILPLELVDDLLLQKRAFLISSNNPALLTHPVAKPDIVVDIDAMTVEVKNTSLDALLRLTVWEQQFARRIVKETSFSSIGTEEQSPSYGSSTSISRHATDLLQQTIASLASHAAAHGLHFLRSKEEGTTSELHGFHASGAATLAADLEQHRRRAASAISPRDNRRHSNSSRSLGRGKQTVPLGGSRHRETEERKRYDDNSTSVSQSSAYSRELGPTRREGGTALTSNAGGVDTATRRQLQQRQQHRNRPEGQGGLPGIARFQEESRTSSDAMRPPSVVDLNWEAQADLIRAEFAQHLEQLCRRAAVAAGRERSRQLLLHHLSSTTADDGENLRAFGVEWVKGWSETHNFQAWLYEHHLPNEGSPLAKHGSLHPPPTSGYAKYLYSNGDRYEGQFWASQRHGYGVYCSTDGMRYDGSWVNDERHGHGVLDHEPMGYLYVGQWQHNKKSGEGHLYSRKERYWGNFVDNKYHGRGRYVQRDGLEYEGEFARGRFEGLGKLSLSRDEGINTSGDCRKGVVIRGSFEGGKVTGVVNAVYADGKTYTGELSPETLLPEGGGSMLYRDSCLYDGQWRSGMRHGAGVLTIPVGVVGRTSVSNGGSEHEAVIVDGQWQDDMPDPDAEWSVTFPTGDKYLGQLKFPSVCSTTGREAGKDQSVGQTEALARIVPHGWGLSKRKDTGEVYEGQWRCGMRHGNGECITRSGARHSGKWRFGHPHGEGRHFDPTRGCTIEGTFYYGKLVPETDSVENEEACEEPPAGVPMLVFEAFDTFPLSNCLLFQPRGSAHTASCTLPQSESRRNYGG